MPVALTYARILFHGTADFGTPLPHDRHEVSFSGGGCLSRPYFLRFSEVGYNCPANEETYSRTMSPLNSTRHLSPGDLEFIGRKNSVPAMVFAATALATAGSISRCD